MCTSKARRLHKGSVGSNHHCLFKARAQSKILDEALQSPKYLGSSSKDSFSQSSKAARLRKSSLDRGECSVLIKRCKMKCLKPLSISPLTTPGCGPTRQEETSARWYQENKLVASDGDTFTQTILARSSNKQINGFSLRFHC